MQLKIETRENFCISIFFNVQSNPTVINRKLHSLQTFMEGLTALIFEYSQILVQFRPARDHLRARD